MTSRRDFLVRGTALASGLSVLPRWDALHSPVAGPNGFIDLRRAPDSLAFQGEAGVQSLTRGGEDRWTYADVAVEVNPGPARVGIRLIAPRTTIRRLRLRWHGAVPATARVVGDAWERGYGDLEWRGIVPDRVMPWYCATTIAGLTHGYGVGTGPNAFCSWQLDADGITLWADVRSGGSPLHLGDRVLPVCEVVCRAGHEGESAHAALSAFCRQLCPAPRMPPLPVYGSNDWYWAYGKNSAASVRLDAQRIVDLSPPTRNRPFAVIDDGWQPGRGADERGVGSWDRGNDKFGDMAALAEEVVQAGARPGIWIRPLQAPANTADSWRLPRDRATLDPTVPDVLQRVAQDFRRVRRWGYELIKHDYTTFEIFGRWGFQMGTALTKEGWTFAEGPRRTTAEVINELYHTIRDASGDALVIGCNTVSHLSAGVFEICRIGDDTSGTEWSRTRRMGVNSLAFRGVQHGSFYAADADCVGVTNEQPWSLNRQWLDLLARSGTMLMVSLAPDALDAAKRRDLRQAMAIAALPQALAEPLDWQDAIYPTRWRLMGTPQRYDWVGPDGADLP
jgi:alpha-galactosidase